MSSISEQLNQPENKSFQVPAGYRHQVMRKPAEGPFYLFSPGERVAVFDDYVGVPYIEPGRVQILEDYKMWERAEYFTNPDEILYKIDPTTGRDVDPQASYVIPAGANLYSLLTKYGPGLQGIPPGDSNHGLIQVTAFAKFKAGQIGVDAFNQKISVADSKGHPVHLERGRVPEEFKKEVGEYGALAVRRRFVSTAREFFASQTFLNAANAELQGIYLKAISEILTGYDLYEQFAHEYMTAQDRAVREGDKKGYDTRDYDLMWLLARQGVDTALTRALSQGQGGLTGEQLQQILTTVQAQNQGNALTPEIIAAIAGQAAAAAVAAMQSAKPTEPERVSDVEEFGDATGGKRKGQR